MSISVLLTFKIVSLEMIMIVHEPRKVTKKYNKKQY